MVVVPVSGPASAVGGSSRENATVLTPDMTGLSSPLIALENHRRIEISSDLYRQQNAVLARPDADYCNGHSDQHRRQRPPEISDSMVTLDQNFERPKSNVSKKRPQLGEAEAVVICCARQPRGGRGHKLSPIHPAHAGF